MRLELGELFQRGARDPELALAHSLLVRYAARASTGCVCSMPPGTYTKYGAAGVAADR